MPEQPTAPSAPLHREIEWQLATNDLERVRHWLTGHASLADLSIAPRDTRQLRDIYLDTDDFRIFRAGFALRLRAGAQQGEATLKALASARKDVADRVELSETVARTTLSSLIRLHGPVGTRVRAVAGRSALRPLFEVRTRRQRFTVTNGAGDLGEIALDETAICKPGGEEHARVQRVEVEAQGAELAPLAQLVKTLATECDLHRAPLSKYELGLRSMGLDPFSLPSPSHPPSLGRQEVQGTISAADAALVTLRQLLSDWASHEPAARLGDDPAELHQLRVAARRMDAVLELFAPWLPRSLAGVRETLRSLLSALGEVRDHDLQLQGLASFQQELGPAELTALEPLTRHIEAGRAHARRQMLQRLDALATRTCFERLAKVLARARPARPATAATRLSALAPELIRSRFRRLRKAVRRLGEPVQPVQPAQAAASGTQAPAGPTMEDYHRVRRRAKRLRYALEPLAGLFGKPAQEMLRSLRRLQDRLGVQQDTHVARARLAHLVSTPQEGFAPLTVFLAGRLAERHAAPAGEAAERIDKAWRKLAGPRWKALRRRMQALADGEEAAAGG